MRLNENTELIKKVSGEFIIKVDKEVVDLSLFGLDDNNVAEELYQSLAGKDFAEKTRIFDEYVTNFNARRDEQPAEPVVIPVEQIISEGLSNMIKFFSEFNFAPSYRFINTVGHMLKIDTAACCAYIANYFRLTDSPYAGEVEHKMESMEFKQILNDIQKATVTKQVNSRFKIYYGSQGTGKTTKAMNETDNLCIVCNSSMLPSDLMEDFTFSDGKATFNPSALCRCMEEGKPIVLDEINLLPFDSLRFLQGIFDGKTEFQYKGQTVHIKDGFKVIGTMNLVVNGVSFGLPEPLVDRCEDIKEFTLTAEMLMNAF